MFIRNIGFTKVGDHWGSSISELAFEASKKVLGDIRPDAIIVANAYAELTSSQANLGSVIADAFDLDGPEAFRVESAGASGAAAIQTASGLIKSGEAKSALVVGVEKMRDLDPQKLTLAQALSEHAEYSQFFGISFPSMNALIARMYMKKFGIDREKLSSFPVLAHRNSSTVAHAQFRKKFTVEEVSRSEVVSDPLRVLDCAPVGDGAAAALFVSGELLSPEERGSSVELVASESSSGRLNFFERDDPLHFDATQSATKKALAKSGLTLDHINFFEIHDSYSIGAGLSIEAIGLSKKGHAFLDASSGRFDLSGKHPVSTFGGMKARGYPVGAAGVYQVCEAFLQLTEKAEFNQVPHARRGLIHTMSGIDSSAHVHVVSRRGAS